MTMRFEGRELKPYAEPVTERELREGTVYFFVHFADEEMLIPTMEPFVYVGKNLESEDTDRIYFQDVESFSRGVRYNTATDGDDAVFQTGSQDELGHIFEYEHAIDQLLACALRRRKSEHL
jgi:hypothetical protein